MITLPKDNLRFKWTQHIKNKMVFYGLSQAQVIRVFRSPERLETGVAEDTVAGMQTKKKTSKQKPNIEEIWVMYQKKGIRNIMISTWRYPGKSPKGNNIPIPEDILNELKEEGYLGS